MKLIVMPWKKRTSRTTQFVGAVAKIIQLARDMGRDNKSVTLWPNFTIGTLTVSDPSKAPTQIMLPEINKTHCRLFGCLKKYI